MKGTWIIVLSSLVIIMGAVVGCKDDMTSDLCPVQYKVDTENTYNLYGKWQFVGFYDTISGQIDPPLCGNVESWIEFTDSTHTQTGQAYKYPIVYRGSALINYFSGSYQPDTQQKQIELSATVKTKVKGTPQVEDFETRFHNILSGVSDYHILNNELFLVPSFGSTQLRFVAM
ncbi:hypothetical protein BH09BAC1_BH09BAC1_03170 [soil metagenome]